MGIEFHLFHAGDMSEHLKNRRKEATRDVDRLNDDAPVASDASALATGIVAKYEVDSFVFDFNAARVREMQVRSVMATSGDRRAPQPIALCIPFTGPEDLLPLGTTGLMWYPVSRVRDGRLCIELKPSESRADIESQIQTIKQNLANRLASVKNVLDNHNDDLRQRIPRLVEARRQEVIRRRELIERRATGARVERVTRIRLKSGALK